MINKQALSLTATMTLVLVLLSSSVAAAREPIALGISVGGNGRDLTMLSDFTSSIGGNQPALWTIWSQWGSRGQKFHCYTDGAVVGTCRFPTSTVEALPAGVLPVIWWEPWDPANWERGRFERYKRIVNGAHDRYIENWAEAAAAYGGRVILRFAQEANGSFFPWSIGSFDNNAKNFKQAWRHVWRIFQAKGATNVEFMWSVTNKFCRRCNPFAKVFPGEKYVDWAGLTAFNWGPKKRWVSMAKSIKRPMQYLRAVTIKPVILAELASHWKGGSKAIWIKAGYNKAYDRWPRLKAIMYLNVNSSSDGHVDWRLVRPWDGSALEAYQATASKARFQGSLPAAP